MSAPFKHSPLHDIAEWLAELRECGPADGISELHLERIFALAKQRDDLLAALQMVADALKSEHVDSTGYRYPAIDEKDDAAIDAALAKAKGQP